MKSAGRPTASWLSQWEPCALKGAVSQVLELPPSFHGRLLYDILSQVRVVKESASELVRRFD